MRSALFILLFAAPAWADLEPASNDWDGLSQFADLLRGRGQLTTTSPIDLSALPADAGLALLGPVEVADTAALRRFVHGGGRLLLAVEGPASDALLAEFELRSADPPSRTEALVRLRRDSGRFAGRQPLVTNHPGALLGPARLQPLFRHADGSPFAFHVRAGAGEALILADTSVFINLMQRAPGNRAFAGQVAAWLGAREAVALAGPAAEVIDERDERAERSFTAALDEALGDLGGAADGPGERTAVDFFLALFLAAVVAYLLRVFPGGRGAPRPPLSPLGAAGGVERKAGQPGGPAAPESTEIGS